jgi:hypothetical protein
VKLFAVWRRFLTAGLVLGVLGVVRIAPAAGAAELQVAVACPGWTPEAAAQVEARIRTSFLTEGLEARRVTVSCSAEATHVVVEATSGSSDHVVERRSGVLEDDVIAAAQDALHELAETPSAGSEAASEPEPAPDPQPTAPIVQPASAPIRHATLDTADPKEPSPPQSKLSVLVQAGPSLELWSEHWAVGGEVSAFARTHRALGLGGGLGGGAALGEPASFNASEWNASLRLQLTPEHVAGLRTELGLGASMLVASPSDNVTASSATLIWTASFDFRVSRPFSLGAVALVPALGVRVFSGRRDVRVNDQERLLLPVVIPRVVLGLVLPAD